MEAMVAGTGFWQGKRVLVTGHTGFKGAWLTFLLQNAGATVFGYSLPPATNPSLFELLQMDELVTSIFGDVRDRVSLESAMRAADPDIVLHLAAQPLVREGLRDPGTTFETNIAGLVYVIEAARNLGRQTCLLNVTTDKVYVGGTDPKPHEETDRLGGSDPYSVSKACAELISECYRASVLVGDHSLRISTARAGNVIGGGDWSLDRIVPDVVRSIVAGNRVILRYPNARRPWQHVLEPLSGYMMLVEAMSNQGAEFDGAWNFGPDASLPSPTVAELTERLIAAFGEPLAWTPATGINPEERQLLQIDSSKAARLLGWRPRLTVEETVEWTVRWYSAWRQGEDMRALTLSQIDAFFQRGSN